MDTPTLTMFYDGLCPLCSREIAHYRKRTKDDPSIVYSDITAPDFDAKAHGLDAEAIHRHIHVKEGERTLVGVDAFIALWRRAPGFGWMAKAASAPGIYHLSRVGYAIFAKLRPLLPRRKAACEDGVCRR